MFNLHRYIAYALIVFTLTACGSAQPAEAATKAQSISFLLSQVRASGVALSGGKVDFYEAGGTTTRKTVWLDRNKATAAANPYTLDSNGTAQLYGDGLYRIVIKDSAGVTKYDRDYISIKEVAGNVYDVADYASFAAAVASIGNTPATLQFASDVTVSANLTIPATLELMPLNGAKINHTTYTIAVNSSTARWPLAQIFNGTGDVTGLKESHPEYFATNTTPGTTDMGAAIIKAWNALGPYSGEMILSTTTYAFASPLSFVGQLKSIQGAGQSSVLAYIGNKTATALTFDTGSQYNTYRDFQIMDAEPTGAGTDILCRIYQHNRSSWYGIRFKGVASATNGVLLDLDNLILSEMYSTQIYGGYTGMRLLAETNAVNLYGTSFEAQTKRGVWNPVSNSLNDVAFWGATFESITNGVDATAIQMDHPTQTVSFHNAYFEANDQNVKTGTSGPGYLLTFDRCYFSTQLHGTANIELVGGHIVSVSNSQYETLPLVNLNHASASYRGRDNFSTSGKVEVIRTLPGASIVHAGSVVSNGATGGGLFSTTVEASSGALSGASGLITLSLAAGYRVTGVQFRVDTAITGTATSWSAAFAGGATDTLATTAALAKNTKVNTTLSSVLTGSTNIVVTANGGTFSAGNIKAVVFYERLLSLDNAP